MEDAHTDQNAQQTAHRRSLMLQRRCGHCAELLPARVLLQGKPCKHCGKVSSWRADMDAEALIKGLDQKWSSRRWWFYGILAVSTLATGMLPLAASLLTVLALIYARIVIVRQPIQWFGPSRRFTTRFTLRLWMLLTGLFALVGNELLTLLPWANMPLKMLVSVIGASFFVEGSLMYLRGRLRQEASSDPGLKWWEWMLPVGLIGGAIAMTVGSVAAVIAVIDLIQNFLAPYL